MQSDLPKVMLEIFEVLEMIELSSQSTSRMTYLDGSVLVRHLVTDNLPKKISGDFQTYGISIVLPSLYLYAVSIAVLRIPYYVAVKITA